MITAIIVIVEVFILLKIRYIVYIIIIITRTTATQARTLSDFLLIKYCLHALPFIYHQKGLNEASYDS